MTNRPTFIVALRPEPNVDGVRALRFALKVLKRRFGLQALSVFEKPKEIPDGLAFPRSRGGNGRAMKALQGDVLPIRQDASAWAVKRRKPPTEPRNEPRR